MGNCPISADLILKNALYVPVGRSLVGNIISNIKYIANDGGMGKKGMNDKNVSRVPPSILMLPPPRAAALHDNPHCPFHHDD
jgi:hypothetical protein